MLEIRNAIKIAVINLDEFSIPIIFFNPVPILPFLSRYRDSVTEWVIQGEKPSTKSWKYYLFMFGIMWPHFFFADHKCISFRCISFGLNIKKLSDLGYPNPSRDFQFPDNPATGKAQLFRLVRFKKKDFYQILVFWNSSQAITGLLIFFSIDDKNTRDVNEIPALFHFSIPTNTVFDLEHIPRPLALFWKLTECEMFFLAL